MAPTLKLTAAATAELDLSTYVVVQEDGGLDPADGGFLEPMFSESAVGDGQALVNVDTQNKELIYPVNLKAATKDALHTLVQTIRLKLSEPDVRVEWRDDGASLSTFYDLAYGRIEPAYKYFRARQKWLSGNLHLWVRPYGHTGTERVVGTSIGSGVMRIVSVPSIAGDVPALVQCDVVASVAAPPYIDLVGVSIIPSGMTTEWRAASLAVPGIFTATLVGASGALASQYWAIGASSTGNIMLTMAVPQLGRVGRQRVFALARTPNLNGAYLSAVRASDSTPVGPTAFIPATSVHAAIPSAWQGWQLLDVGVLPMAPSAIRAATDSLSISGGLVSGGTKFASYGIQIAGMYVLPEDRTAFAYAATTGRNALARNTFDGVLKESYDFSTLQRITGAMRGGFPELAPGNGEQVAAFAFGVASNAPLSAAVRVRERFSFQR